MVLITHSGADTLKPGAPAPSLAKKLPATDGNEYDLISFRSKPVLVVAFTCNHCPYAQAYEDRLISLAREFMPQGAAFVAINSNDDRHYPQDSFANMKLRAAEKNFPFPYLRDKSQKAAKAFGAVCTPHLFVFGKDRKLAYEGRIDDNWKEPEQVKSHDLRNAIEALLKGQAVPVPATNPMGCSIKWKDMSFSTLIYKRQ